jgi:para-aminobenzoate synthetase/4-amino-4-deoxychorismate lyase
MNRLGREPMRLISRPVDGPQDPLSAIPWLAGRSRPLALSGKWAGGGLILAADPVYVAGREEDPFALLDQLPAVTGSPESAVGGGWFGWFGFDLARRLEELPQFPPRPVALPAFDLAFYDHLVRFDGRRWFFEALWTGAREPDLGRAFQSWRQRLAGAAPAPDPARIGALQPYGAGTSAHAAAIEEAIERVVAGELLQANICLRLESELQGNLLGPWIDGIRSAAPAYGAFVAGDDYAVASLSPELFLQQRGREVVSEPIKGTAPRDSDPVRLTESGKDRAENVMIVDLMRNDLGRVAEYGSVVAEDLCHLVPAAGVWHLVSRIRARLRAEVGPGQLLRATFPPGSVTGAPKIQALKLISELEQSQREVYCGAIGLCSPVSGLELNVAIRTLEAARGRVWLGVGGGIVADSKVESEVAEALTKARGVAEALGIDLPPQAIRARNRPGRLVSQSRPDPRSGVFETILVRAGAAVDLDQHRERLDQSCRRLGLALAPDLAERVALEAAGLDQGALRVEVTRSRTAIRPRNLPRRRPMRLEPVVLPGGLGREKWLDRGLVDSLSGPDKTPLFCDLDGSVLEAGYAAVVVVEGDRISVPPLDGRILPSISRARLLGRARGLGYRISETWLSVERAQAAEAVILTSSLRGPHPGVLAGGPSAATAERLCQLLAGQESTDHPVQPIGPRRP